MYKAFYSYVFTQDPEVALSFETRQAAEMNMAYINNFEKLTTKGLFQEPTQKVQPRSIIVPMRSIRAVEQKVNDKADQNRTVIIRP